MLEEFGALNLALFWVHTSLKVKVFIWLASHRKIFTDWADSPTCFCHNTEKFAHHLLLVCPFSRLVWLNDIAKRGITQPPASFSMWDYAIIVFATLGMCWQQLAYGVFAKKGITASSKIKNPRWAWFLQAFKT